MNLLNPLFAFKNHHPLSFGSRGFDVCRNLLFCSRWYDLHPFENLRRKGVNEHGPVQMSGVSGKFFSV